MTATTSPEARNLRIWNSLQRIPLGSWIFTQALCSKAPYFRTVHPRVVEMRPGPVGCTPSTDGACTTTSAPTTPLRRATCNELAGGMMTEATVPSTHRWIPVGMTVTYKAKATTAVTSVARLDETSKFTGRARYLIVPRRCP